MNSKRKIEINIVEVQTYKILIQINSFELKYEQKIVIILLFKAKREN